MQQWDYLSTKNPDLARAGAEGWELVAVRGDEWVFKRPAPSSSERFTREQAERILSGGAHPQMPALLNPQLAALARRIGHTQMLLVCDGGFPVAADFPLGVIDLSVTSGVPTVPQILQALLPELPHDRVIVAAEMQASPERYAWHAEHTKPLEVHSHAMFKRLAGEALACVRTGDGVQYANAIVVGG